LEKVIIKLIFIIVVVENYEEIIVVIFQFIKMIRESGVQKWVFDEVSKIAKTAFQFKEKMSPSSYTSHVANSMHNSPIHEVLSRRYLISEYDASIIQKLMDLLTPENFRLTFVSPKFETSAFQKAAYYGTEYMVSPFTDEFKAVR
jgi:insulysin